MTKYRLSRLNRGLRTKHSRNQNFLRAARWVFALLATGAFALATANTNIISRALAAEAEARGRIEQVFVSCLEHGGAYLNGTLHLCRPVDTYIAKGDNL